MILCICSTYSKDKFIVNCMKWINYYYIKVLVHIGKFDCIYNDYFIYFISKTRLNLRKIKAPTQSSCLIIVLLHSRLNLFKYNCLIVHFLQPMVLLIYIIFLSLYRHIDLVRVGVWRIFLIQCTIKLV